MRSSCHFSPAEAAISAPERALSSTSEGTTVSLFRRPLEGFLVHIHMAWLYVVHAEFLRRPSTTTTG